MFGYKSFKYLQLFISLISLMFLAILLPPSTVFADEYDIEFGDSGSGEISPSNEYDVWFFKGNAGDNIQVSVLSDGDLYPFLMLQYNNGDEGIYLEYSNSSNSSRNSLDAKLSYSLKRDGEYVIIATHSGIWGDYKSSFGEYEIFLEKTGERDISYQGSDVYIAVIDGDGHGDTVVDIIAGRAPDAIIMPMYPADNQTVTADSILKAVYDGAEIINLSSQWSLDFTQVQLPCDSTKMNPKLGGGDEEVQDGIRFWRNIQRDFEDAVDYALRNEVLIFAAIDVGTATPACIEGVIGVGATGQADSEYVDILANESNSSRATPVVTAEAARLMAKYPEFSPAQIVDALPSVVK